MKYILLIYGEENFTSMDPEEFAELVRQTDALNRELFESGELVGAYGVADAAASKVVSVTDGPPAVTDGPKPKGKPTATTSSPGLRSPVVTSVAGTISSG